MLRRLEVIPFIVFFVVLLLAGCENAGSPLVPRETLARTIRFSADTLFATPGEMIRFSLNFQGVGGGATEYEWSFGDESKLVTTTTDTVSHAYSSTGTYAVRCRVVHGNSGPGADSAACLVIVQPFPFGVFNKLHVHFQLEGLIHEKYQQFGTPEPHITDSTYTSMVKFWVDSTGWASDPDTMKGLVWVDRQFTCTVYNQYLPNLVVIIVGSLSDDLKSIKYFRLSKQLFVGIMSHYEEVWDYELTDIPLEFSPSGNRNCHLVGAALQGRVTSVAWRKLDSDISQSRLEQTLVSWSVNDRASLMMEFLR